jgi:hypothetical protein
MCILYLLEELEGRGCVLSDRAWNCDRNISIGCISIVGFFYFVEDPIGFEGRVGDFDLSSSIKSGNFSLSRSS